MIKMFAHESETLSVRRSWTGAKNCIASPIERTCGTDSCNSRNICSWSIIFLPRYRRLASPWSCVKSVTIFNKPRTILQSSTRDKNIVTEIYVEINSK
jgi:hypothetical protein